MIERCLIKHQLIDGFSFSPIISEKYSIKFDYFDEEFTCVLLMMFKRKCFKDDAY